MNADCIGCDAHVVFRLPRPTAVPQGWNVQEVAGVIGDRYRVADQPGKSRHSYYYWPWLPVRETPEEAERDAVPEPGDGEYVYGVVARFPLGGYVWYQTGLQPRPKAEEAARQAMAMVEEALADRLI